MTVSNPRVPLQVQPLEVLRARYRRAITEVVDQLACAEGERDPPSGQPAHVFDTAEGWRLIISKERRPDGRVGLHLSASIHDRQFWLRLKDSGEPVNALDLALSQWRAISGERERTPTFLGWSEGGVPHWFLDQGDA